MSNSGVFYTQPAKCDQLSAVAATITQKFVNLCTCRLFFFGIFGLLLSNSTIFGVEPSASAIGHETQRNDTTPNAAGQPINGLGDGTFSLSFDPALFEVWGFATGDAGNDYLWAVDRTTGHVAVDDYRHHKLIATHSAEYDAVLAGPVGLTTWDFLDFPLHTIKVFDKTITFRVDTLREEIFDGLFNGSCLSPAAAYFETRRKWEVKKQVLLYLFDKPVTLRPTRDCEEELYLYPHNTTRIIAPVLVAKNIGDKSILIAGRSYASMPVVISESAHTAIVGDNNHYFVVDKDKVDAVSLQALNDFRSLSKSNPRKYHGSGELAMMIEQNLLKLLPQGSKQ